MQRLVFKSVDEYREWRAHWRREYKQVSADIHNAKTYLRKRANNMDVIKGTMRRMRHCQMTARSMMLARTCVEYAHKINRHA